MTHHLQRGRRRQSVPLLRNGDLRRGASPWTRRHSAAALRKGHKEARHLLRRRETCTYGRQKTRALGKVLFVEPNHHDKLREGASSCPRGLLKGRIALEKRLYADGYARWASLVVVGRVASRLSSMNIDRSRNKRRFCQSGYLIPGLGKQKKQVHLYFGRKRYRVTRAGAIKHCPIGVTKDQDGEISAWRFQFGKQGVRCRHRHQGRATLIAESRNTNELLCYVVLSCRVNGLSIREEPNECNV